MRNGVHSIKNSDGVRRVIFDDRRNSYPLAGRTYELYTDAGVKTVKVERVDSVGVDVNGDVVRFSGVETGSGAPFTAQLDVGKLGREVTHLAQSASYFVDANDELSRVLGVDHVGKPLRALPLRVATDPKFRSFADDATLPAVFAPAARLRFALTVRKPDGREVSLDDVTVGERSERVSELSADGYRYDVPLRFSDAGVAALGLSEPRRVASFEVRDSFGVRNALSFVESGERFEITSVIPLDAEARAASARRLSRDLEEFARLRDAFNELNRDARGKR